jgi:hypothetical protein
LPVFAGEIVDQNAVAFAQNRTTDIINLKSVLIGNGNTDPAAYVIGIPSLYYFLIYLFLINSSSIFAGRYEIECGKASYDIPFQSISACVKMKAAVGIPLRAPVVRVLIASAASSLSGRYETSLR